MSDGSSTATTTSTAPSASTPPTTTTPSTAGSGSAPGTTTTGTTTTTPKTWTCETCTYADNDVARSRCGLCDGPRKDWKPKSATPAKKPEAPASWVCSACTLSNPGTAAECVACGTASPHAPVGVPRRRSTSPPPTGGGRGAGALIGGPAGVYNPDAARAGVEKTWADLQALAQDVASSAGAFTPENVTAFSVRYKALPQTWQINWTLAGLNAEDAQTIADTLRDQLNAAKSSVGDNSLPLRRLFNAS